MRRQKGLSSSAKLRWLRRVSRSASSLHSAATQGTKESGMSSCTDCTHWAMAVAEAGRRPPRGRRGRSRRPPAWPGRAGSALKPWDQRNARPPPRHGLLSARPGDLAFHPEEDAPTTAREASRRPNRSHHPAGTAMLGPNPDPAADPSRQASRRPLT